MSRTESLLNIAHLAIKAQQLREAADRAKREFADAVRECIDFPESDEYHTAWLFHRHQRRDSSGAKVVRWIDANGNDASDHPTVIRNQEAYREMRAAKKAAGHAKAALTKAIKRHRRAA